MNYYLNVVSLTLEGKYPDSRHELSFAHPEIESQQDWEKMLVKTQEDAERFAKLIDNMEEQKLWENISPAKGSFYRNILGVIEHNHYHAGQIVLLKKILAAEDR